MRVSKCSVCGATVPMGERVRVSFQSEFMRTDKIAAVKTRSMIVCKQCAARWVAEAGQ